MHHTSRASHPAPRRRESKTAYARGEQPRTDWQKFPRQRCRPLRSSSRQIIQADDAVSFPVSCRAKSRHPAKLPHGHATGFLDFARNDEAVFKRQRVNPKLRRRFHKHRITCQVRGKLWIRLRPPKSISGENKMRRSSASQPRKILDCLLAVVWSAVVNRIVLG